MKKIFLIATFIISNNIAAQVTEIPDPEFEQRLINLDIDSDGTVNGQMLTSDAEAVTELILDEWEGASSITDLTGLQDFTALEKFVISFSEITALDVTHNFQLRELRCGSNFITELDLSANPLLEVIDISTGGDVGPFNAIHILDLSSNPNVHTVIASDCNELEVINLRNGANNQNMLINIGIFPGPGGDWNPDEIYNTVCIEIDDEAAAQSGQSPYSEWDIEHPHVTYNLVEDCTAGVKESKKQGFILHPNPAKDIVSVVNSVPVEGITIYDSTGRTVLEKKCSDNEVPVNISALQAGNYIIKVTTATGTSTQKLIVF